MKKKILFIHVALWKGGIETALTSMLSRMDYERYDVTCLILADQQELADRVPKQCRLIFADRQHPVTFESAYRYKRLFNLLEEPMQASSLRRAGWRVLQLFFRDAEERLYSSYIRRNLPEKEYDAVVLFSSKACGVGAKLVSAPRYLCFYHYSDLERVYHDWQGYRKCSRLFAVSENMTRKLKDYLPQYREKIEPLHNLVDTRMIRKNGAAEPACMLDQNAFRVVSCGRLVADKGFDLALKACAELVRQGYTQLQWYIVGEGPEHASLEKQICAARAAEHMHLLGAQSNPYPILRQADLFVQSSRIEAFGLTITEAQALGVPVLSTKTDGGTELIRDEETGLLCDISAEAIEDGVRRLLRDKALYDGSGRARQALTLSRAMRTSCRDSMRNWNVREKENLESHIFPGGSIRACAPDLCCDLRHGDPYTAVYRRVGWHGDARPPRRDLRPAWKSFWKGQCAAS